MVIPAYNEYRKSAKKTAYRSDLLSLHKGWLAFGVELDSFCERETTPNEGSIANVGMQSLLTSKLYADQPGKENFIGFSGINSSCSLHAGNATGTGYVAGTRSATLQLTTATIGGNTPADKKKKLEVIRLAKASGDVPTSTQCELGVTSYNMGVAGHISGDSFIGFSVNDNGVINEKNEGTYAVIKGGSPGGVCTT